MKLLKNSDFLILKHLGWNFDKVGVALSSKQSFCRGGGVGLGLGSTVENFSDLARWSGYFSNFDHSLCCLYVKPFPPQEDEASYSSSSSSKRLLVLALFPFSVGFSEFWWKSCIFQNLKVFSMPCLTSLKTMNSANRKFQAYSIISPLNIMKSYF